MEPKKTQIIKAILRNKVKSECIKLPGLKLYYKAMVIKIAWQWHQSDTQLNGMKLRAHKYTHTWTISMQQMSEKNTEWRKDDV